MPDDARTVAPLTLARDRAVERLTDAFAHDRLSIEEYELRLERVYSAASLGELDRQTADLDQQVRRPGMQLGMVREEERIASVMSEVKRRGAWTPARRTRVLAVMSETTLDFREAQLAPGITDVEVTAIMATVKIIVPPGVRVVCEATAFMGTVVEDVRGAPAAESPYVIRIRGSAVMAEIKPKVMPLGW